MLVQPQVAKTVRRGSLDGLRGLAALMVVVSHLTLGMGLLPYDAGGFIGVVIFFVLSGYLIGAICWRGPSTLAFYGRFITRRVQRLTPVLVALVLIVGPLMVLLGGEGAGETMMDAARAASQTTAFFVASGYDVHPVWGPTWSLTVEWTFYLLFPVGLLFMRRAGWKDRRAASFLLGLAVLLYGSGLLLPPIKFYLLPVANLGVMLAGAGLAVFHAERDNRLQRRLDPSWGMASLVLLGLLAVLPSSSLSVGYKLSTFPAVALGTLAIIECCQDRSAVERTLNWRPLTLVGRSAYSIYLWHVPVFWLVWVTFPQMPRWIRAGLAVAILVPIVAASYGLLERPWLRGRHPQAADTPQRPYPSAQMLRVPQPAAMERPTSARQDSAH